MIQRSGKINYCFVSGALVFRKILLYNSFLKMCCANVLPEYHLESRAVSRGGRDCHISF